MLNIFKRNGAIVRGAVAAVFAASTAAAEDSPPPAPAAIPLLLTCALMS